MTDKEQILDTLINHYLTSDYNGMHLDSLNEYDSDILCTLIDENYVEVLSSDDVLNPYIKGFEIQTNKEQQKNYILSKADCVLYPSKIALEKIDNEDSKPYTNLMRKGSPQFNIIYFNIEILDRYFDNPKFLIYDCGYRGMICPKDEFCDDPAIENEYIRDYGMAYIREEKLNRAIGVFVYDLAKLSAKKQQLWHYFELENHNNCVIHYNFIKNLIQGEWATDIWIFDALIDEIAVINNLCSAISIPPLFNHTFGYEPYERPYGYRTIFYPTKKNYYDFITVLEKMVVHNLSYDTFTAPAKYIRTVERKDENGKEKGTLQMLEEWLSKNTSASISSIKTVIIAPLRKIRKIRQSPAHKIYGNEYDIKYYTDQQEIMSDTYISIANIRKLLSSHPLAKHVEIPDYLIDGSKIVQI